MLELIKKLISFDTTQKENEAMKFIQEYIQKKYRDVVICQQQDIWDHGRYNLIVKNTEDPDIILAWHIDTVPEFSKEQFVSKIEGNRIYGRGAVDMKAGVVININLIDIMLKHNINFWVLCYGDEENNFWWMKKFTEIYKDKIHPKLTIITEPTNTAIYTGFRGIAVLDLEIKGKSVHSARKHLGINAIEEYVHFIDHLEKHIQSKDRDGYTSLANLAGLHWGIYKDKEIIRQDNIVPNIAKGSFSLRLGNDFSYQDLEKFTQEYFTKKWIEIIHLQMNVWYNPLIQIGLQEKYNKYGDVEKGYEFWYSDIQLIKEYMGGDCLLIGPWPNEQSHQSDEYVEIDSIEKAKKIIENILKDF